MVLVISLRSSEVSEARRTSRSDFNKNLYRGNSLRNSSEQSNLSMFVAIALSV